MFFAYNRANFISIRVEKLDVIGLEGLEVAEENISLKI